MDTKSFCKNFKLSCHELCNDFARAITFLTRSGKIVTRYKLVLFNWTLTTLNWLPYLRIYKIIKLAFIAVACSFTASTNQIKHETNLRLNILKLEKELNLCWNSELNVLTINYNIKVKKHFGAVVELNNTGRELNTNWAAFRVRYVSIYFFLNAQTTFANECLSLFSSTAFFLSFDACSLLVQIKTINSACEIAG